MKQLIRKIQKQAVFPHFPYPIFPACADASAGRHLPFFFFLFPLLFFLITACPDPPPETKDCGAHQIKVNGDCECEPGYHWNEDQTKCLMDTTSHSFNWYYDQPRGSALSSDWSDVTIVNENDIWVVGYIETDEYDTSTGLDYSRYNASYWDGNEWTLTKITLRFDLIDMGQYVTYYDSSGQNIRGIYYIENELWFMASGGGRARLVNGAYDYFEGQYWNYYYSSGHIWGTSSSNMYIAGTGINGDITHYNGSSFNHSSPGSMSLSDIWGLDDNHIWAVGCNGTNRFCQIIYYDGSTWQEIYFMDADEWYPNNVNPDTLNGHVYAVWAYGDTVYYGTSHGLWRESVTTHEGYMVKFEDWGLDKFRIRKIRGNGYNDIFVAGHAGQVVHFNGKSWKVIHLMDSLIEIKSMAIKNDMIVIVGHDDNIVALTIRGYR